MARLSRAFLIPFTPGLRCRFSPSPTHPRRPERQSLSKHTDGSVTFSAAPTLRWMDEAANGKCCPVRLGYGGWRCKPLLPVCVSPNSPRKIRKPASAISDFRNVAQGHCSSSCIGLSLPKRITNDISSRPRGGTKKRAHFALFIRIEFAAVDDSETNRITVHPGQAACRP